MTKYKILKINIQIQNDNISNFTKDKIIDNKEWLLKWTTKKQALYVVKIKVI